MDWKKILNITSEEIKFIFKISFIVTIIVFIPYFYGYFKTPSNYIFLGLHLTPGDIAVYRSYIEQVKNGNWIFENLFHNEFPPEKNFNLFWLAIGILAKYFHFSSFWIFHIIKIILIPICLLSLYGLISFFFQNKTKRKLTFILTVFTSGLSGIFLPIFQNIYYSDESRGYYHLPMDLWVPESNVFLTLYHSPHFIASLTCLLLIFLFFLLSLKKNAKYSLIGGMIALFFFNFHPFYIITVFGVISIFLFLLLLQKEKKLFKSGIKSIFIIGFLSFPSIFYHLLQTFLNPLIRQKAKQNICATPHFLLTLISYSPFIFLAFGALVCSILIFRKSTTDYMQSSLKNFKTLFLFSWFIGGMILIYLPFIPFQRRLSEGLQIPIIILSVSLIAYFFKKIPKNKTSSFYFKNPYLFYITIAIIFSFLVSSNLFVLFNGLEQLSQNTNYFPKKPIIFIKNRISPEKTILSHYVFGNFIPGLTGRRVFAGHWAETYKFQNKKEKIIWFFKNNNNDKIKKTFLKKFQIDYIYYGPLEKSLGNFNPEEKKYLKKIFQEDDISIYQVILNENL